MRQTQYNWQAGVVPRWWLALEGGPKTQNDALHFTGRDRKCRRYWLYLDVYAEIDRGLGFGYWGITAKNEAHPELPQICASGVFKHKITQRIIKNKKHKTSPIETLRTLCMLRAEYQLPRVIEALDMQEANALNNYNRRGVDQCGN